MARGYKITLVKSPIGYSKNQRATAESLGLRKVRATRVVKDEPAVKGMIQKIIHLLEVEPCEIES